MDEFSLTEYVNARCGEVYLSREGTLIFLCSLCNESFKGYGLYLGHIISEHDLPVHSVEEIKEEEEECGFENEGNTIDSIEMLDDDVVLSEFEDDLYEIGNSEFGIDTKLDVQTGSFESKFEIEDFDYNDNDGEFTNKANLLGQIKERQALSVNENTPVENKIKCKSKIKFEYPSQGIFQCPICKLAIKGKSNLEKHILRHNDNNKRFQCSYCPKRFHVKFELRQHESSHTGERPYLCTICGRRFVSTGKLNEHTNMIHENVRNKNCEICNKSFYSNKYLRRHMMTHSNERCHKCEVCGSSFKIRKTLTAHMKLHLNKREYECKLCCAQFNQRPALHSHMKTRHKSVLLKTKNYNNNIS